MLKKREDGRFMKMVPVGYDEQGNSVRKAVYAKSSTELTHKVDKLTKEHNPYQYYDGRKITVGEWVDEWLQTVVKNTVRINTWESYEGTAKKHIIPAFGGIPLTKLQPQMIRRLYQEKLSSGLSGRTVQYIHTILNAALKQAVIDELINKNPCDAVKKPQKKKKEIKPLSQEQIHKLLEAAKDSKYHTIILLDWATGMRRGELVGLRWQDINFKRRTVSVQQTIIVTKAGPEISDPKSETSRRTISIPVEVVRDLERLKAHQAEHRLKMGFNYQNCDLAFPRLDGRPMDPRDLTKEFKRIVKKAGLPDTIRLHDLRHTHATLLMLMDEHLIKAQHRLGHATLQQTSEYTHLVPKMQDGIADKLSKLLNINAVAEL